MAKKFLSALDVQAYVDLNKNELRNARVQNLASAPETPVSGQIYFDTGTNKLYWYNGSSWVLATGDTVTFGSPTGLTVGGSNSDGAASTPARSDHVHSLPGWGTVTAQTSFGAASGSGSASTFSRSDHTHGTPAAPTASSVGAVANSGGSPAILTDTFANRPSAGTLGRLFVDTTNGVVYRDNGSTWEQLYAFGASASTQAVGDASSAGTAVTVSRSDHKHALPAFGSVTGQTSYGASSGNGSASTIARSDHTHGTPSLTSVTPSTQAVGDSAVVGTGTAPAREDHKHAMPSFGNVSSQTSFGGSSSNGSASTLARSDHTHGTPAHDASAHSAIKLSDLAAPAANVSWGTSYKITNLADPSSAQDAATKAYVDSVAAGLTDFKMSVRAASTTNITLASGAQNGSTLGGVTLATGNRILLAGQTAPAENGIYTVNASGAPTRAVDADASGDLSVGTLVYAEEGTNGSTQFICSATGASPWVPNSSTSTWVVFQTVASSEAGAGLTQSGGVLAVGAGTGITVNANDVAVNTSVVARKHIPGTGPATNSTSWAISHNLGNRDVLVSVYDASTYAYVDCDVTLTDANTVTLSFGSTVTANTLRAVVIG